MGCMRARRGAVSVDVCEVVRDNKGRSWPDVSEWFWHALLNPTGRPWWSYVVVQLQ